MLVDQDYSSMGVRIDQLKAFLAELGLSDPKISVVDPDTFKALAAELSESDPETVVATTWLSSILPSTRRLIMMPM
jgi:hypothetical protein